MLPERRGRFWRFGVARFWRSRRCGRQQGVDGGSGWRDGRRFDSRSRRGFRLRAVHRLDHFGKVVQFQFRVGRVSGFCYWRRGRRRFDNQGCRFGLWRFQFHARRNDRGGSDRRHDRDDRLRNLGGHARLKPFQATGYRLETRQQILQLLLQVGAALRQRTLARQQHDGQNKPRKQKNTDAGNNRFHATSLKPAAKCNRLCNDA